MGVVGTFRLGRLSLLGHLSAAIYLYVSDESEPSWLAPYLELKDFQLGKARDHFPFNSKSKIGRNELKF